MIEDIEKIQLYLSDRRKAGMADKIESNLISRYKRNIEWSLLSPEDKQNKRKSILKSVTKYLEEDGIAAFPYENAVVGFYEAGLELQKILTDKKVKEDILLLRLSILIQIDMDAIDSDSTLHNKMITLKQRRLPNLEELLNQTRLISILGIGLIVVLLHSRLLTFWGI